MLARNGGNDNGVILLIKAFLKKSDNSQGTNLSQTDELTPGARTNTACFQDKDLMVNRHFLVFNCFSFSFLVIYYHLVEHQEITLPYLLGLQLCVGQWQCQHVFEKINVKVKSLSKLDT